MKRAIFWVLEPCSVLGVHRRFRGVCCLHQQGGRLKFQFENQAYVFILIQCHFSRKLLQFIRLSPVNNTQSINNENLSMSQAETTRSEKFSNNIKWLNFMAL
jgi:hypothetical protein